MRKYGALRGLKIAVFFVVALLVFGFVTMYLWNWLMPAIFHLTRIGFAQALGLVLLSKILFGGFHRHGGGRRQWKQHMEQRWAGMSPEERERFRSGMRGWRGCRVSPRETPETEQGSI